MEWSGGIHVGGTLRLCRGVSINSPIGCHHPSIAAAAAASTFDEADLSVAVPFWFLSLGLRWLSEMAKVPVGLMAAVALVFGIALPAVRAQAPAPAPTSDGISIDQGVAYVLMLVALVLTYLIHPLDASSSYKLF